MARSSAHRILHRSTAVRPGARPQGIRKTALPPLRKSERIQQLGQRLAAGQPQDSAPSRKSESLGERQEIYRAQGTARKRTQHEAQPSSHQYSEQARKRPRSSPIDIASREDLAAEQCSNRIDYWRKHDCCWPKGLFDPDPALNNMLARKKSSSSSLRRRALGADSATDTSPDSVPYQNSLYIQHLAQFGIFMDDHEDGVDKPSEDLCVLLLEAEQAVPQESLFCDRLFKSTCRNISNRNEARVVRDIGLLIVPSAEHFEANIKAEHLEAKLTYNSRLIESTDETWNGSIKIYGPKPKPDYSVGFRWDAFEEEQIKRLSPYIGNLEDKSPFKATCLMYFPFLTSEVKCGTAALDIADNQNAHSMGVAVRAVVQLFRFVQREKELHRVLLGFSISHNHREARIYGHYPAIAGKETRYYRQFIDAFDFTAAGGKNRWKSYQFVTNIYEKWMPGHFKRICSAIDELPLGVMPTASPPPGSQSGQTALTQESTEFELAGLVESTGGRDGHSISEPSVVTPNTSVSHKGSKQKRKRKQ